METKGISRAVIKRLPRYYRYLGELLEEHVERISSNDLSKKMRVTASQIRQDLNNFGGFGQQGYGYNVEKLCEGLAEILGIHRQRKAILVGVGNIGRALLKNFDFQASGFELICAFDTDKTVIGMDFGPANIRDVAELFDYVDQHQPDIAVLTVPHGVAPKMAKELVAHGIRGIWNITGEDLHLEELGIPVENVHFSDSLMTLCYAVDTSDETVTDQ